MEYKNHTLVELLVKNNLISEESVDLGIKKAEEVKLPLIPYLIKYCDVSAKDVAMLTSTEFGLPMLDIGKTVLDPTIINLVNSEMIRLHHVLPIFRRYTRLFIATADPANTSI